MNCSCIVLCFMQYFKILYSSSNTPAMSVTCFKVRYYIRFRKTMETKKDLRSKTYNLKVTAVSQEYKSYWLSKLKNSESNYKYIPCVTIPKKPRSLEYLSALCSLPSVYIYILYILIKIIKLYLRIWRK